MKAKYIYENLNNIFIPKNIKNIIDELKSYNINDLIYIDKKLLSNEKKYEILLDNNISITTIIDQLCITDYLNLQSQNFLNFILTHTDQKQYIDHYRLFRLSILLKDEKLKYKCLLDKGVSLKNMISRCIKNFNNDSYDKTYTGNFLKFIITLGESEEMLTQKQKLKVALYNKDVPLLINYLNDGTFKITMGFLRYMYDDYLLKDEILKFLDNLNSTEFNKLIDKKKFKEIKYILNTENNKLPNKTYPRGYKQYRLLKYITTHNVTTRLELTKLVYELGYGPNSFNSIIHSGTSSTGWKQTYSKYYDSDYNLNIDGVEKLKQLSKRFKLHPCNKDAYR